MLEYEKKNGSLLVRLSGELDHRCAAAIREELDALIEQTDAHRLVFDLKGLTFMDSSGIGMMIGRYKRMRVRGGTMGVIPGDARIERMMELSGLYQIVDKLA